MSSLTISLELFEDNFGKSISSELIPSDNESVVFFLECLSKLFLKNIDAISYYVPYAFYLNVIWI